jgi:3-oxoadipate enol-lactonase
MEYASNGNVRIAYDVQGAGPPLVLVHANPFDHRLWMYQVARYSGTFKTVAIDLRGYGESGRPQTPFTLRDMADDVLAAARAADALPAIFMGCSVGANIGLLLGLDNPYLVNGLVLVGGGARMGPRYTDRVEGYLRDLPGYHREHLQGMFVREFAATPLGSWLLGLFSSRSSTLSGATIAQIFRALGSSDVSERLGELKAPTLLVNGAFDNALPNSREVAAAVPHARHVIIPDTGHACGLENPVAFDAVVAPFLEKLRA